MNIRQLGMATGFATRMSALNERHPWSHNDAFHTWIHTRLPDRRGAALDVGCGRGELVAGLAGHFDSVHGTDADALMRQAAASRCAGVPNVTIDGSDIADAPGEFDLVTMIAVLHHLDLETALGAVRAKLRPGGRFLCVGLARPQSVTDHVWDVASMVTNPLIGYVRHPWAASRPAAPPPFPIADPHLSFAEIREVVQRRLPGASMRRQLAFRHTIEWERPVA